MVKCEKEQLKEKQFLWANKRSFIIPNHVAQIKTEKYSIVLLLLKHFSASCSMSMDNTIAVHV